jgi:Kef-type K+ transport system membrane component KefB
MDILFFVGIAIIAGFLGGRLGNRLKLPAVEGYLIAGLFLGPSVLRLFSLELLDKLGVFNDLALALVAFIIGSEMRLGTLRKMRKGIITIILSESFGAFLLVAAGVYLLTRNFPMALVFGAMAPASAPAGTAVVLQEYKAKGPLTDALYAVVGLDDGLAIVIYAFAVAFAKMLMSGKGVSILGAVGTPFIEVVGAIALGGVMGFALGYFIRKLRRKSEILGVALGAILVCAGLSKYFHLSLILSNLTLGMVFANLYLRANRRTYQAIQPVTLPIYIIFFVIAGAHLQVRLLPAMGVLGLVYIAARTCGLVGGASFGAAVSRQARAIRKYLGFGILSQSGVAIGLALLANMEFSVLGKAGQDLGVLAINTIAATTIVFEIIGPIGTKFAISRAGETGKRK